MAPPSPRPDRAGAGFGPRQRAGLRISAEVLTWDLCVFRVQDLTSGATAFVARRGPQAETFLAQFDAGELDVRLKAAVARPPRRRLRRPPGRRTWVGTHVGIEHEYRVIGHDAQPVDARTLLHELDLDGVRADPSDPNAYRCAWGGVITCDGRELEVATPPCAVRPGFVEQVVASAAAGRAALESALGDGLALVGYSTHLSVSAPRRGDDRLARRYATTYGPALMMLLDRVDSPGLLVRPRPGRLELCGEHAEGLDLEIAVAFAVSSVLAARQRPRAARRLRVRLELAPAVERYGWYVDRRAAGPDLYRSGRATMLERRDGSVTAARHLAEAWATARPCLIGSTRADELAAVDATVAGARLLPIERDYAGTAS